MGKLISELLKKILENRLNVNKRRERSALQSLKFNSMGYMTLEDNRFHKFKAKPKKVPKELIVGSQKEKNTTKRLGILGLLLLLLFIVLSFQQTSATPLG